MNPQEIISLASLFPGALRAEAGGWRLTDPDSIRTRLPAVVERAVFSADRHERQALQQAMISLAPVFGIVPHSIWRLYQSLAKADRLTFCVPAFNLRVLTFDSARALFRAARAAHAGAFAIEIARLEMEYTDQRPLEFAACVCSAAIVENWTGPIFLQGDHFQIRPKAFGANPASEILALKSLIDEALKASFFNIDLDASTLVDLSRNGTAEQQAENIRQTVELASYIRQRQGRGDPVSIGGEVGEVGKENTTAPELRAYLQGVSAGLKERAAGQPGLSKASVQTGSRHGGIVLTDGSVAPMAVDFETIAALSRIARQEFQLAGVVQHGASTLPDELYQRFPSSGAVEIHLSTLFQSVVLDHPAFPLELKEAMREYVTQHFETDRDPDDSEAQFWYRLRKKAVGPFKRELWRIPLEVRTSIAADLEARFRMLFELLGVSGTAGLVRRLYSSQR